MNGDNTFNKPVDEFSDGEIRHGLAVLGQEIERQRAAGRALLANVWTELAAVLAAERDRRTAVGRAVDDAMGGAPLWSELPGEPS